MELIPGRLEGETKPRLGAEIEDDLVCSAGGRPGHSTGKTGSDRSMEMPTQNALDLGVATNNLGQAISSGEPGLIHPADPR